MLLSGLVNFIMEEIENFQSVERLYSLLLWNFHFLPSAERNTADGNSKDTLHDSSMIILTTRLRSGETRLASKDFLYN